MKTITVGIAAGAAALTMIGAPVAHADDNATDTFIENMHAHGFNGKHGDDDLVSTGRKVCVQLMDYNSAIYVRDWLQRATDWAELDATYFEAGAVTAFCPWKAYELDAPVTGLQND